MILICGCGLFIGNFSEGTEEREKMESRRQRQAERGTERRDRQTEGSCDGNIHEREGPKAMKRKREELRREAH